MHGEGVLRLLGEHLEKVGDRSGYYASIGVFLRPAGYCESFAAAGLAVGEYGAIVAADYIIDDRLSY